MPTTMMDEFTVVFNLKITEEMDDAVRRLATDLGLNRTSVIRMLTSEGLRSRGYLSDLKTTEP